MIRRAAALALLLASCAAPQSGEAARQAGPEDAALALGCGLDLWE